MTEYETPIVGHVFNVVAWWSSPKGQLVPCRVEKLWGDDVKYADVKPLVGNPHWRSVRLTEIRDRIGGHPMETP